MRVLLGGLLSCDLAFDGGPEAVSEVLRNGLGLHTFVYLKGFLGGVDDNKTVGASGYMAFEVSFRHRVDTRIQIVVEFLQKLLTG